MLSRHPVMFALLFLAFGTSPGWSQEARGTIQGSVADTSGAAVPGVVVRARWSSGEPARSHPADVRSSPGCLSNRLYAHCELMVGREGSLRTYREIEVPDSHHLMTHHKGNAELIEKVYRINRYHMELFAGFVDKLSKTPEGDGCLLDHSLILYGGGLADGNRHQHDELPVMMVGGACGSMKGGRHVKFGERTPLNNLYVSMLDKLGVHAGKLGDSTGIVKELSELG